MEDNASSPGPPESERRREDIERLKRALRAIADRLSNANHALEKAADMQRDRKERAAHAAEQLKKALDELRKRREQAMLGNNSLNGERPSTPKPAAQGDSGAQRHLPADPDDKEGRPLPKYKGDFSSEHEYQRLTNLPPITEDEIRNTNWDLLWKFMDF